MDRQETNDFGVGMTPPRSGIKIIEQEKAGTFCWPSFLHFVRLVTKERFKRREKPPRFSADFCEKLRDFPGRSDKFAAAFPPLRWMRLRALARGCYADGAFNVLSPDYPLADSG